MESIGYTRIYSDGSVWLAGSVPRIRVPLLDYTKLEKKRDGRTEKLERSRRNRVLSSP